MSEQAPHKTYEKDKAIFERLRALPMDVLLQQAVEEVPFAVRVLAYCRKHDVQTIGQLAKLKRTELLQARNLGRKTVKHIQAYLNVLGLALNGRLAVDVPLPAAKPYARGAHAMKLRIIDELMALDVPHEIVKVIGKLPLPKPDGED
jgi:hypothetical protein